MVNLNGWSSKQVASFQMSLLSANIEQLKAAIFMVESEIVKRQLYIKAKLDEKRTEELVFTSQGLGFASQLIAEAEYDEEGEE